MRLVGHAAQVGEKKNAYSILVKKPEEKKSVGRTMHMWKDNIKVDLKGIRWDSMDWIHLAQDRDQWQAVMNIVMNLWVTPNSGIF